MATEPIEEYMYELTRAVGDAYTVVADGIGSKDTPGSALFEASQLKDLVYNNAPYFGILRTDPQGFKVVIDDPNMREVLVKSGKISYNGQIISLEEQRVKIGRDFASPYTSRHVYGLYLGIPISEAEKMSQIYSTTIAADVSASSTLIAVEDIQTPINLGFPIQGYIGSEFVVFTGVEDRDNKVLKLSNALLNSHSMGGQINFVYKPKIKTLCGLPVDEQYQSGQSVDAFEYFPPIPSDWLAIAKLLVVNPQSPKVVGKAYKTSCAVATTNISDIPEPSYANGVLTASSDVTKIDGVDIAAFGPNDKILIKNLSSAAYNGIYYRTGARTFARHSIASSDTDFDGDFLVNITNGTQNKNKTFLFVRPSNFVLNTTSIAFSLYSTTPVTVDQYEIKNLVVDWPYGNPASPVFGGADAKIIGDAANKLINSLTDAKQTAEIDYLIRSLEAYTRTLSDYASKSFKEYWATRPFKPTSYFSRGVSFGNLERFEFPEDFVRAYYNSNSSDLNHTFAVFRGDLYKDNKVLAEQMATPVDIREYKTNCPSTLLKGTYIYGVTAINDIGETSPKYQQFLADMNDSFVNEISSQDNVPTATSYNIYRRTNLLGEQVEYKLTKDKEIRSLVVPYNTSIASDPTNNFTLPFDSQYTGVAFSVFGRTTKSVFETLMGGIEVKLAFDNAYTLSNPSAKIDVYVYDKTLTNVLATGTPIYFSQIGTNGEFKAFISKFTPAYNLYVNDYVWVVLKVSELPQSRTGSMNILLLRHNVSEANTASSFAKLKFTTSVIASLVDVNQTYYKVYGYIDDGTNVSAATSRIGVKLTGEKALTPSRLRVCVPDVDFSGMNLYEPTSQITHETLNPADPLTNTNTRNELKVTVIAQLGDDGVPTQLPTVTVSANTPRGTFIPLGTVDNVFDRVIDVWITPGSELRTSNRQINWSIYDLITIETM